MGPLRSLRVLDFGQGVAGPYCGQLLGDQGAEVIKVEPPRGDWSREMGRRDANGCSGVFLSVNRNKRGVCLDLRREADRNVARALAAHCDVLVESFRPGVMARLGLDWERLRPSNPRLIYCSVTGFGPSGPNAALPAGDSTMQAYGGLMSIVGEAGGAPLRVGNVVSDMVAGTNAFSAVLLALHTRASTGRGQQVSTSLLDSIVAFQAPTITEYLLTSELPVRHGNQHPLISPSGAYETSDGHITITVLDHQWREFCQGLHLEDLAADPRFATSEDRQVNRDQLNRELAPLFRRLSTEEWIVRLRGLDVLCAPINDYERLLKDPQVAHNRLIRHGASDQPMIGNPVRLENSEPAYCSPPALGQHTGQVLADVLGWDSEQVRAFVSGQGSASSPPPAGGRRSASPAAVAGSSQASRIGS